MLSNVVVVCKSLTGFAPNLWVNICIYIYRNLTEPYYIICLMLMAIICLTKHIIMIHALQLQAEIAT